MLKIRKQVSLKLAERLYDSNEDSIKMAKDNIAEMMWAIREETGVAIGEHLIDTIRECDYEET